AVSGCFIFRSIWPILAVSQRDCRCPVWSLPHFPLRLDAVLLKDGWAQSQEEWSMEPINITEVAPEQLKTRLERGDDVVVVDLRQVWEYHAGHIPGAISLFIEEVPMRLNELPTDVDIVFQCWRGHTSLDVAAYGIQQ